MTNEPYRTRTEASERTGQQLRGGVAGDSSAGIVGGDSSTGNQDSGGQGTGEGAAGGLGRRRFFGLVAGAAALAAIAYAVLPGHSGMPEPPGQIAGPEYLAATLAVQPAPRTQMPPMRAATGGAGGWTSCAPGAASNNNLNDLDLVLAIDTTGSMGRVIEDVKNSAAQLIANLRAGGGNVRVGIVAYRDLGDQYVTLPFPLTPLDPGGVAALNNFLGGLRAAGGGDWPEKMDAALAVAAGMNWRGTVPASIVVIADAPAHNADQGTAAGIAQDVMSKLPGGLVSLIDTGSGGNGFMQALPKAGGGQYVTYDGHILNSLFPAITGCSSR